MYDTEESLLIHIDEVSFFFNSFFSISLIFFKRHCFDENSDRKHITSLKDDGEAGHFRKWVDEIKH